MNRVAIIQARMGSTRLPNKVLMKIMDKPMLWYIVDRLKRAKNVDDVVIATSNQSKDDAIESFCKIYNINYFRGSESDVLDRFYNTAKEFDADIIYRITGDCPLVDPSLIDALYEYYINNDIDFSGLATGAGAINEVNQFPDGLDIECFNFKILEKAYKNAIKPSDREHVTPYIWRNNTIHRIGSLNSNKDYSYMRWTVDNQEDFEIIEQIYISLYPKKQEFDWHDVIDFFEKNRALFERNSHFIGNEGYEELWKN